MDQSQEQLIATRKKELLSYIRNFYQRSWDWRSSKFHEKWDRIDRNYHSIYDPTLRARKKPWQSTMFVDITLQNVEVIASQIFKTMMAPTPPIRTEAGPAGDALQANLVDETMEYQLDKSSFKIAYYDTNKESVKYGSGFMKLIWERVEDNRMRRSPVLQTPNQVIDVASEEALRGETPLPEPSVTGFSMQNQKVLIKNCLKAQYVHIRDVFPEPNTTTWDKVIHRDKLSYGEIVRQINSGSWFDVRAEIEDLNEGEKFESDLAVIKQERGYNDSNRETSKFEKRHTVWELWAPLPRKWIQFDIPEGDKAEELVPAVSQVVSGVALLSSTENTTYDGECAIVKDDYIRTGETYGKGIGEILFDDQDEINEHSNLGIDNMNLLLNKMIVVIENALVNSDQDLVSQPGGLIRLKQAVVDDVRKAVMTLDFPDLANSYFRHRYDIERMVQEKTGANRVTLGSSDTVKDTNQTLGGMELLRQMFNERVAAYGMVKEDAFLKKVACKIYGLIYQNLTPEDMVYILGDEPTDVGLPMGPIPRYLAFAFIPPEELYRSYRFKPQGIFSMENKVIKSAQALDLVRLMTGNPKFDATQAAKDIAVNLQQIPEAEKWFLPGPPGGMIPPAPVPPGEAPGMKGGPNGNQPSFLPPNPVRREPVFG